MSGEQNRLKELYSYQILDTLPEKELDELTEIASAICDTPISLLSFVDESRQWFKAKKNFELSETPRSEAFCQHALSNPQEVLVVDDPLNDERFKNNSLVQGNPHIRFYAGAHLQTPKGHVLGTLCVLDSKPRSISEGQKRALQLLAKKAMEYLETRRLLLIQNKTIEMSAARLNKLTDQAPGAIFQLEMSPEGKLTFPFISKGMFDIHPTLKPEDLKADATVAYKVVYPDDVETVKKSIEESYLTLNNWSVEYRVITEDGEICWHWANAKPEKGRDGTVVWYGTFQDITQSKKYIKTLEELLFEISHGMRKPVATMLGLTAAIERNDLDEKTLKRLSGNLRSVSKEMDDYIKKLNDSYFELKQKVSKNSTD